MLPPDFKQVPKHHTTTRNRPNKNQKNFARPYSIKNDQIWENQGFHVHEKHACMHAGIMKLGDYELHAQTSLSSKFQVRILNRLAVVALSKQQNSNSDTRKESIYIYLYTESRRFFTNFVFTMDQEPQMMAL